MTTLVLELHDDLLGWLQQIGHERGLPVEAAIARLLDEVRMKEVGLTDITVPELGIGVWQASMPWRGTMYGGYDVDWTLIPGDRGPAEPAK